MQLVINYDEPRGWIKAEPTWTYSALNKCKACPGRARFTNPIFWFERNAENDEYFKDTFPNARHVNVKEQEIEDEMFSITRPKFKFLTTPDEQQHEALKAADKNPLTFAFFEKPGFGKTKTILDHVTKLWCKGIIDGLIIFAPNIVHEQWIMDEIPKHIHPSIPLRKYIFKSSKKVDRSIIEPDKGMFRILALNIEASISNNGQLMWKDFARSGKIAIVVDESHRMKQHSGKISKTLYNSRSLFTARFIATGTPDPLGLQDYFAQMRFLNQKIIGVNSFTGFKSKFCVMGGYEGKEIRGYMNIEELHKRMSPYVHVGAPVIDGEKIFKESKFDLPPHARKAYQELAENYLFQMEDGRLATVQNQLSALVRLHQLACGRLILEDGTVQKIHNERLLLLKSLLGRYEGKKVVIWNRFTADMEEQVEFLGKRAVGYWGVHSDDERRSAISRFLDADSGVDYFVASPAAAGTGLNLQGTCWINIYFSSADNYGQREQSEHRTYRRGVEGNVLFIDMLARKTVDIGIHARNKMKHNNSTLSYNEFKELIGVQK